MMAINYDVEYPKLQRKLRMAETVNRDQAESYEKRIAELEDWIRMMPNVGSTTPQGMAYLHDILAKREQT